MSDTPRHPDSFDRDDIWSLAESLPLNQVISVARARAAQGDVTARAFLAMITEQQQERLSWLRQAADGGDVFSMLELAGQYLAGGDHAQAFTWFERAAAQGSAEAHVRLGIMIAKGQGVAPDPLAAISQICAARQTMENESLIEFVLDEQDFPFDLGDRDVYYPHVIERIFGDYSRQDKQRVYDYLHTLGVQAESDDAAWEAALTREAAPAQEHIPKWLTQFLHGLASQSEHTAAQARLLSTVLDGVQLLNAQQSVSLEVAWFDALHDPEEFLTQLHRQFPQPPIHLQALDPAQLDTIKTTIDAVMPLLRHADHRVQQQRRKETPPLTPAPAHAVTPVHTVVESPAQPATAETAPVRFAPYQFNVTSMKCGNRSCAWVGSMTQTDHQRCPLCKNYRLTRVGGWQLLNGSVYATQRDSLLKKHLTALRTVSWFLYATAGGYQALASAWGNAAYKVD